MKRGELTCKCFLCLQLRMISQCLGIDCKSVQHPTRQRGGTVETFSAFDSSTEHTVNHIISVTNQLRWNKRCYQDLAYDKHCHLMCKREHSQSYHRVGSLHLRSRGSIARNEFPNDVKKDQHHAAFKARLRKDLSQLETIVSERDLRHHCYA